MRHRFVLLVILVGCFFVADLTAQSVGETIAIELLMSADEFKAAGLAKLSARELAVLNRWLAKHQATASGSASSSSSGGGADLIESRIAGDFGGWDGETIFQLQNGQIWQQASMSVLVAVRVQPKVTIYRSEGSYRLRVEGIDRTIRVRRLK